MRKIISYFFSICAAILLILSICLCIVSNTVLNSNFLLKKLEENDYYNLIDINIKSEIEGYTKQSGLDAEVFEEIYSKDDLKEDINSMVISMYNGETVNLNGNILEENLRNKINIYIELNNISLNQNEQKRIDEFVQKIVDIYVKEVSHPVYLDTASKIIINARKIIELIINPMYIAVGVLEILIFIINIKHLNEGISFIALSMLIASFFLILTVIIFNWKVKVDYIIVLNTTFTLLVISILKEILQKTIITCIIITGIAVILALTANMKKFKKSIAKNT